MVGSGNDAGQYHAAPEIPALEFEKIYAWVSAPGSSYRDYSSSRQETRDRFNRRLLLKRRLDAARARESEIATARSLPIETATEHAEAAGNEEEAGGAAQLPKRSLAEEAVLEFEGESAGEFAGESIEQPMDVQPPGRPDEESVASPPEALAQSLAPAEEDHGGVQTTASSALAEGVEFPLPPEHDQVQDEQQERLDNREPERTGPGIADDIPDLDRGTILESAFAGGKDVADDLTGLPLSATAPEETLEERADETPEETKTVSIEDQGLEQFTHEASVQAVHPCEAPEPSVEAGEADLHAEREPEPGAREASHADDVGLESEITPTADAGAKEMGPAVGPSESEPQPELKAASDAVSLAPDTGKESDLPRDEAVAQQDATPEHKWSPAEVEAHPQEKRAPGSRWYALRSAIRSSEAQRMRTRPRRLPVIAVFSQAGGVGKTSLVATLGRILAARGEEMFLAETASPGFLPLFFGSGEQTSGQKPGPKLGMVRTFAPPAGREDAAIRTASLDPQQFSGQESALTEALLWHARGSSRILIDIQTGAKAVARQLAGIASTILIPLLPDMSSIMTLDATEAVFEGQDEGAQGSKPRNKPGNRAKSAIEPLYLLNQFDGSLPLHVEARGLLQERLGARLLPFALRREEEISEALAEGMTVFDYAPQSCLVNDFLLLADWMERIAPAPSAGLSALRWSEQ